MNVKIDSIALACQHANRKTPNDRSQLGDLHTLSVDSASVLTESKEYVSWSMLTRVCSGALAKSDFLSCSVNSLPMGLELMYLICPIKTWTICSTWELVCSRYHAIIPAITLRDTLIQVSWASVWAVRTASKPRLYIFWKCYQGINTVVKIFQPYI